MGKNQSLRKKQISQIAQSGEEKKSGFHEKPRKGANFCLLSEQSIEREAEGYAEGHQRKRAMTKNLVAHTSGSHENGEGLKGAHSLPKKKKSKKGVNQRGDEVAQTCIKHMP
jgi:hypothetical protein